MKKEYDTPKVEFIDITSSDIVTSCPRVGDGFTDECDAPAVQ